MHGASERLAPIVLEREFLQQISVEGVSMALKRTDNAVLFWNGVLLEAAKVDSEKPVIEQEHGGPTRTSRVAAIVHAAIHNAVNGVARRNTFYQDPNTGEPPPPGKPPPNPKQEAAGSGAAYQVLVSLYPKQQQQTQLFDKRRADFEAALPAAKDPASFQYGAIVAQQLLDARMDDVPASVDTYNPPAPSPGVWAPDAQLAPPGPPLTPGWATFVPSCWTLSRAFVRPDSQN
jgi:hypothetical protein